MTVLLRRTVEPVPPYLLELAQRLVEEAPELVTRNMRAKLVGALRAETGAETREAHTAVDLLFASIAAGTIKPAYRLHQPEYRVQRVDGTDLPGGTNHGARYFVLDVGRDPAARVALAAYATTISGSDPELHEHIWTELDRDQLIGAEGDEGDA